ncbi:MAG: ATP phosphoribosyltransferase regulatory subunit [Pseudomonadota bacterium]
MIRPLLTEDALAEIEGMLATLARIFSDAGYAPVEPAHLFPAETLLELYGEDVRARAFLFNDPEQGGELCLRPDFTVPVALAHGDGGWERARGYAYHGPVFRRQEPGSGRAVEYVQAGLEDFGAEDRAAADAHVFALTLHGLDALSAPARHVTTGDLSIIFGLLDALELPEHRAGQLRRHLWRPQRFQRLIQRFSRPPEAPSDTRSRLLQSVRTGRVAELAMAAGEPVGRRSLAEVTARAERLAATAAEAPMPGEQADLISAVLAVKAPMAEALQRLREIAAAAGVALSPVLDRFESRMQAMASRGLTPEKLSFDASFGRNLEYYDGFVFEVLAEDGASHPPLAGGGRYDSITARLGAVRPIPAVGAMIRPEAVQAAIRGRA